MFSDADREYLKALVITSLRLMQEYDFKSLSPDELVESFESCLEGYQEYYRKAITEN